MTDTPAVSVVLISFDGEQYIAKAIQSVLDQTWRDLELIVVDDGSTDGTAEVIRGIRDPRLRYVRQENAGPSAARNTGIEASTGEWVAFLDCDDWWRPTKLETQLAVAKSSGAAFVCSGATLLDEGGAHIADIPARLAGDALPTLLLGNGVPGGGSSAMIRKSTLEEVGGFDVSIRFAEDWDCWLRIAARHPVASTSTCDVCKLTRPDSYGLQTEQLHRYGQVILDRAFRSYAKHLGHLRRSALASLHYLAALDYNQAGDRRAERRTLRKLLQYRPLSFEAYRRFLRTFFPGRARRMKSSALTKAVRSAAN